MMNCNNPRPCMRTNYRRQSFNFHNRTRGNTQYQIFQCNSTLIIVCMGNINRAVLSCFFIFNIQFQKHFTRFLCAELLPDLMKFPLWGNFKNRLDTQQCTNERLAGRGLAISAQIIQIVHIEPAFDSAGNGIQCFHILLK